MEQEPATGRQRPMMYDFEVLTVGYFTMHDWTRVNCAHCRYTAWGPEREAVLNDFLQHFQAVHQK
jgi:hypothetical protein